MLTNNSGYGNRHRQDAERKMREVHRHSPEEAERLIRAREREVVAWISEKPWRAGSALRETIAHCRRVHTESIARSIATRRAQEEIAP